MVSIPLYSFLILYFIFLAVFAFFSFVNIMHIVRTGTFTMASFLITVVVACLTLITFILTWQALQGTDWKQPVTVWNTSTEVVSEGTL